MSSKNEIKTALERAEFLINRNKESIKNFSDHIDELAEKKKALEIDADALAEAGDFNGCKSIRKSIQEVTAEMFFFKDKLEHLKTAPLADDAEREAAQTKIIAEYNETVAELKKRAAKIIPELQEIAEQEEALYDEAYRCYSLWKCDIGKKWGVHISTFDRRFGDGINIAISRLKQ